jgi:hypothetical protein
VGVIVKKENAGLGSVDMIFDIVAVQPGNLYIQDVTGGRDKIREGVPYVKLYRKTPKTPISKVERFGR